MRSIFLADMANKHGWKKGAEIGLWYGKTFFHLLDNVEGLSMIGVDIWLKGHAHHDDVEANRKDILDRLVQYDGRATVIEMPSEDAALQVPDDSLDFVFIDGDHSEYGVIADLISWRPKVRHGGYLTGHDWDFESVRNVVKLFLPDVVPGDESNDFVWVWKKP